MVISRNILLLLFIILFSCDTLDEGFVNHPLALEQIEIDSIEFRLVYEIEDQDSVWAEKVKEDYRLIYFVDYDSVDYFLINYIARGIIGNGRVCYGGKVYNDDVSIILKKEITSHIYIGEVDSLFNEMMED